MNEYAQQLTVSQSEPSERAAFICRTYAHLAGAVRWSSLLPLLYSSGTSCVS